MSSATLASAGIGDVAIRNLFGTPVAAVTMTEALDTIDRSIAARTSLHIGVINAAKVVNMNRDPVLRKAVLTSDIIFADGISVVWASKILGRPLPERVAGIDLMSGILERGNTRGYRVFCLGATPQVLQDTVDSIKARFPGVNIVGAHHGYYSQEQEPEVARLIADAHPDVLFVAMTSPKKEEFLARWSGKLNVLVSHGVGGSFDVVAGKVRRAPAIWQRLGLEWLYRVKQEPGRLWRRYLVTNLLFTGLVVTEWLGLRRADKAHGQSQLQL